MAAERIFVGRRPELDQFTKVLEDPQGQAVLVVGQAGMGKTWLVDKMAEIARNHPSLKCGCVRYEVTPTDSVDSTMALMMDNAFEAASTEPGSFQQVPQRRKQWMALLKTLVPKGSELAELIGALRPDSAKNTREQFLERLQLISKRMPEDGRAIFIVDPEKYMQKESDQSWAIVVKALPEKIKFVFAQRSEDVLVESQTFRALANVSRIPQKTLGVLDEEAVEVLLAHRGGGLQYDITQVREVLSKYKGHPYALQGALDLLEAGTKLEELPQDPIGIAPAQWKELCKKGRDAIRLFKTYAILEVGVSNEAVTAVSELDADTLHSVLAENFLGGLLRQEGYGKRIYHAILADHIVAQIGDSEKRQYHSRAVAIYREKLKDAREKQTAPDALASARLAEHVLAAEGGQAFMEALTDECYDPLITLGLLDSAIGLSERALEYAEKGSREQAVILGNLGLIYQTRGDLDKAEQMLTKSLEIEEKLGRLEGMASQYGNLGLIYRTRGDLDKAEKMHTKALEIEEKLGRLEGMASDYGNLGAVHAQRGDIEKAREYGEKALELFKKVGMEPEIQQVQGFLDEMDSQ
ncbi:MAG: tetratricopeptide repeat protein [Planctomycetota bacterium]|jgi:tetratricopeptide (TPR) repeat protein